MEEIKREDIEEELAATFGDIYKGIHKFSQTSIVYMIEEPGTQS